METLVHSGAFDEWNIDRSTLLASIDVAISHSELLNPNDDQFDLFFNSEFSLKPKYVEVEPIRLEDKLLLEKGALGHYLSDHPVSSYEKLFRHFGAVSIDEAISKTEKKVLIGCYVNSMKNIRTKKGEAMAFLHVSDEACDLEVVVFPNIYKSCSAWLKSGYTLLLQGQIETRAGKTQMIVEEVYELGIIKKMAKEQTRLFIKIETNKQKNDILRNIKQILLQHKGNTKVMLYYENEDRYVQLPLWEWVTIEQPLIEKLEFILGAGNVIVKKE
jgi:DNA polymerase III subunit alpha